MNSRDKGKRGELKWRNQLRDAGFDAFRTAQFAGNSPDGSPDVMCPSLPSIHHEVKWVERLNVQKAMDQAVRDAKPDQIPVVCHKKNDCPWLVTVRAEDWFRIIRNTDLVVGVGS